MDNYILREKLASLEKKVAQLDKNMGDLLELFIDFAGVLKR